MAVRLVDADCLGLRPGVAARRACHADQPPADAPVLPAGVRLPDRCDPDLVGPQDRAGSGADWSFPGAGVRLGRPIAVSGYVSPASAAGGRLVSAWDIRFLLQPVHLPAHFRSRSREPGFHAARKAFVFRSAVSDPVFNGPSVTGGRLGLESATGFQRCRGFLLAVSIDYRAAIRYLAAPVDGLCGTGE